MRTTRTAYFIALIAALAATVASGVEYDPDGLVSIDTRVDRDSITVGERFVVTYEFSFPDTLDMVSRGAPELEKTRVVSLVWSQEEGEGERMTARRMDMTLLTLNLEGATVPEMPFDFVTPSGDTLRAYAREASVPVRFVAADTADLKPLKAQWEAPPNRLVPALAAVAAIALGALAWWWWRRRRARAVEEPPVPVLPPDYVALTELTRIEKLGLIERGEFKAYYTLVVDAVRHYLEGRFGVEAMDRTTVEVLDDVERRGISAEGLAPLLNEADLVKFARHVPVRGDGEAAMHAAREVVVKTAPRRSPHLDDREDVRTGSAG
jgi:hypothetical protein